MAIRYFAHGHALLCSWPCAILLMAMRYFAHGHTLFRSWPYAILLMAMRYFAHGHALFLSWSYAISLMAIRYFALICIYAVCSAWNNPTHLQPETDSTSTSEDDCVGGLGKYSHGKLGLSHQHWPEQIKSAGAFSLHDTEAAESAHKLCMRESSLRVKHLRPNLTQGAMLRYLRRHSLFEVLLWSQPKRTAIARALNLVPLLYLPLNLPCAVRQRRLVNMGTNLSDVDSQRQFLHPEVRIARVELMDLLCDRLGMPKSRASYRKMSGLEWSFHQKLVLPSGYTYWATDSQYTCHTSETCRRRRDTFLLNGTELVTVKLPNGYTLQKPTALCCEAVCFITVSNLRDLNHVFPSAVQEDIYNDGALLEIAYDHMHNCAWPYAK